MLEQTCCFTGYRELPPNETEKIAQSLETVLVNLISKGYRYFGSGEALGFDTLAALTVLRLKTQYPQIRLILVLPFVAQDARWAPEDKAAYENIKRQADKIVYTSPVYYRGCYHKRNRHLVNNSSICVCYLTHSSGGTAYTVAYARERGRTVINIASSV